MLAEIKEREFVRVGELSSRFGVSEVTVRGDLDSLAARGKVHRVRGGAIPRLMPRQEQPFEDSISSFAAEKVAIGQAAAALLEDGETVLVDVGTTAAAAARAIAARAELNDVVVFTNGLKTALELEPATPRITVVVLGGTLRPLQHSLVDPLATLILDQISVKTVLLGCNGVDPIGGITNINLPEAELKKRMLAVASAADRARRREQARPRRGGAAVRHRRHRHGDHRPLGRPGGGRGAARPRLRGSRRRLAQTSARSERRRAAERAADEPGAERLREPADDRLRVLAPEDDDGAPAAAAAHPRADQTLAPSRPSAPRRRCGRSPAFRARSASSRRATRPSGRRALRARRLAHGPVEQPEERLDAHLLLDRMERRRTDRVLDVGLDRAHLVLDAVAETQELGAGHPLGKPSASTSPGRKRGQVVGVDAKQRLAHERGAARSPVGRAADGVAGAGVDPPDGEPGGKRERADHLGRPADQRQEVTGLAVRSRHLIHRPARRARDELLRALSEQRERAAAR